MALFKILKGPEYETVSGQRVSRLPGTYHEGYCYFTTDTNKFYVDIAHGANNNYNTGQRVALNSHFTEGLRFGHVETTSSNNFKQVSVEGVETLFSGLTIAVKNDSSIYDSSLYIKINNIIDPTVDNNKPSNEKGYRPVLIDFTTPLTNEWLALQTIILVYEYTEACWYAIGGVSSINEATSVEIIRYETT